MSIYNSIERRKNTRITFTDKVIAVCDNGRIFKVFIKNLSTSGAFINTDQLFKIGQTFLLNIDFIKLDRNPSMNGKVVRIEPDGVGVNFELVFTK